MSVLTGSKPPPSASEKKKPEKPKEEQKEDISQEKRDVQIDNHITFDLMRKIV